MKNRLLSMCLAIVMVVSLLPLPVLAAEETGPSATVSTGHGEVTSITLTNGDEAGTLKLHVDVSYALNWAQVIVMSAKGSSETHMGYDLDPNTYLPGDVTTGESIVNTSYGVFLAEKASNVPATGFDLTLTIPDSAPCAICPYLEPPVTTCDHGYNQEGGIALKFWVKSANETDYVSNTEPYTLAKSGTIEMAAATATVTGTAFTYNGTGQAPEIAVADSDGNDIDDCTIEYKVKGADDATYSATKPVDAGDYTYRITHGSYAVKVKDTESNTGDFTISPATISIDWTAVETEAEAVTREYNGYKDVTGLSDPTFGNIAAVDNADGKLVTVDYAWESENQGTKKIIATVTLDKTHEDAKNYTLNLDTNPDTITKELTSTDGITPTDYEYDGTLDKQVEIGEVTNGKEYTITASGVTDVNGDEVAGTFKATGTGESPLAAEGKENVTWTFYPTTPDANNNYNTLQVAGTITAASKKTVTASFNGGRYTYGAEYSAGATVYLDGNPIDADDYTVTFYDTDAPTVAVTPKDVGTYIIRVALTPTGTAKYDLTGLTEDTSGLTITAKELTIKYTGKKEYDGSASVKYNNADITFANLELEGVVEGDASPIVADGEFKAEYNSANVAEASTITFSGIKSNSANYTIKTAYTTSALNPIEITAKAVNATLTSDKTTKAYGAAMTLEPGDFTYKDSNDTAITLSDADLAGYTFTSTATDAAAAKGNHTISVGYDPDENNNLAKGNYTISVLSTIYVNPCPTLLVVTPKTGLVYKIDAYTDAELFDVKLYADPEETGNPEGLTPLANVPFFYTYEQDGDEVTVQNAGTYDYLVELDTLEFGSMEEFSNYAIPTRAVDREASGTIEIAQAVPAVKEAVAASPIKTGDTLSKSTLTGAFQHSAANTTEVKGSIVWADADEVVSNTEATVTKNWKFVPATDGNYALNYEEVTGSIGVVVKDKTDAALEALPSSVTEVYTKTGKTIPTPTTSYGAKVTVEYEIDGTWGTIAPVNVGTYNVRVLVEETDDYKEGTFTEDANGETLTVKIIPAPVTLVAPTLKKEYDGTLNAEVTLGALSLTGMIGDEAAAVEVVPGGTFKAEYNSANVADANEVTFSGIQSSNKNYEITAASLKKAASIDPQPITATLNGTKSKVYSAVAAEVGLSLNTTDFTYTDKNNNTVTPNLAGYSFDSDGLDTMKDVGDYAITVEYDPAQNGNLAKGNYAITTVGTVGITSCPTIFKVTPATNLTYKADAFGDGELLTVTLYANPASAATADGLTVPVPGASASIVYAYTQNSLTATVEDAGEYDYSVTALMVGNNYQAPTAATGKVTIGQAVPVGTVNADGVKVGSTVGDVALKGQDTFKNPNDNTVSVAGTLSWNRPSIVLNSETTVSEGWTFTPNDTKNYANATGTASIVVTNKTVVTIEAEDKTVQFNGNPQEVTAKSVSSGATPTVQYKEAAADANDPANWSEQPPTNAGTYTVKLSVAETATHAPVSVTVTLNIQQATPQGDVSASKIEYDGRLSDSVLSHTFVGVDGAKLEGTLTWDNPNVGNEAPADIAPVAGTKYTWTFTPNDQNYAPVSGESPVEVGVNVRVPVINEIYNLPNDTGLKDYVYVEMTGLRENDVVNLYGDAACSAESIIGTLNVTAAMIAAGTKVKVELNDGVALPVNAGNIYAEIDGSTVTKAVPHKAELGFTLDPSAVSVTKDAEKAVTVMISDASYLVSEAQGDATAWVITDTTIAEMAADTLTNTGATVKGIAVGATKLTATVTFQHPDPAESGTIPVTREANVDVTENVTVIIPQRPGVILGGGGGFGGAAAVSKYSHQAYVVGYEDGTFRPDTGITRAEAATLFARLKSINLNQTYSTSFTDVSADEWYAPYIGFMEQSGIINGYEDGTFRPDAAISRAEFAAIASRYAGASAGSENIFSDVSDDLWAKDNILAAYASGWINGYPDGTFRPMQEITRAEVVQIMNAMLGRLIDASNLGDASYMTFGDVEESHWAYYQIIEASNEHTYTKTNAKEIWVAE